MPACIFSIRDRKCTRGNSRKVRHRYLSLSCYPSRAEHLPARLHRSFLSRPVSTMSHVVAHTCRGSKGTLSVKLFWENSLPQAGGLLHRPSNWKYARYALLKSQDHVGSGSLETATSSSFSDAASACCSAVIPMYPLLSRWIFAPSAH